MTRGYRIFSSIETRIFLFLFFAYAFFFDTLPGWNVNTRMNLVYAIVDQHKLNQDDYFDTSQYGTNDLAFYKGHYYCDKSPILSFLGVPVYWAWKQVTDMTVGYVSPVMGRYPVVVFTVSLLSAGMAILLYRFLGFIRKDPKDQLWLTIFYSLGTLAFPYSILLYSHQAAAVMLFIGFYILYRLFHDFARLSEKTIAMQLVTGSFLASLAMVAENPAGIGFIGLAGYTWFQLKEKKQFGWFLLGSFIPVLLIMPYNYACFGSPWSFGYQHEAYTFFNKNMSEGFMGITCPTWEAIWGITLSPYRGLFFYCPLLLLAIPGFYFLFKDKIFRKEGKLFLFMVISFFLFNFSYYAWNGGWAVGPRLIVPMLPFLIIPIYLLMRRWRKPIFILGFLSILLFSIFCLTDPQVRDNAYFPFMEVTLPSILEGKFTESVFSLLGFSKSISVILWIGYIFFGLFYLNQMANQLKSQDSLVDK